jgi:citrate lyase subunit beta/citryl-CoA lyase
MTHARSGRLPRSYLFVPGDRPDRFAKAIASGADAVVLDLEDAVAPDAKERARAAVADWMAGGCGPVVVRVNDALSPDHAADLGVASRAGVVAVLVPKAERAEDLARVRAAAPHAVLLPQIESAAGIDRLRDIATAPGVQRLVFGSIDLQLDLGIEGEGEELLLFRSQLVLASRLAGIAAPVDGVSTALDDAAALDADTRRARRLGFSAKLCIHPRQIATVHAAFAPSAEERAWAERVVAAAAAASGAAVAVDGRMVDRPVLLRAEAILEMSRPE